MKRNKKKFAAQLFFVLFFVLFGAFNLYAEGEPPTPELEVGTPNPKGEPSVLERYIHELNENIVKIQGSLDNLSGSISKPQIWQIISAISIALIALLLLGTVVFILIKHLRLNFAAVNKQKPSDYKHTKEHQQPEESKSASQGISSSEFNTLKNKLEDVQYQLTKLDDKIKHQSENSLHFQSDLSSFQVEIANIKKMIEMSNNEFSSLKTDIDKSKKELARKEQVENDPVSAFNQWAQNPNMPLPQYFSYVSNEKMEFRTKQEFTDIKTETEWIRNTIGEKKYLFPNPNKIDNLSGSIDNLYRVIGTRKAKGTNSAKITNACQIKEGNFIEYQGELMLI